MDVNIVGGSLIYCTGLKKQISKQTNKKVTKTYKVNVEMFKIQETQSEIDNGTPYIPAIQ